MKNLEKILKEYGYCDSINGFLPQICDMLDLMEYSKKYNNISNSIDIESVTILKSRIEFTVNINSKKHIVKVTSCDLEEGYTINTYSHSDIHGSFINLPKIIDTINLSDIESVVLIYNGVCIVAL